MSPTQFWSHWGWPACTALLCGLYAVLLLRQYLDRRRNHQLAWFAGMLLYAAGAGMEAWSEFSQAWDPLVYRIYIVCAASLVGFLGLGSLYLVGRRQVLGHLYLAFNLLAMTLFLAGVLTAPLAGDPLVAGITVGGKALGPTFSFPRIMSFFFNVPGTLLLLGTAVLSAWRFARKRDFAYRMWASLWIALGTAIIAFAGSMARAGHTVGLYPAEMAGATFLLVGFLKAGTLQSGAEAIRRRALSRGPSPRTP